MEEHMGEIDLIARLRMIIGTQFTPTETALVTEAADTIQSLLSRIADLELVADLALGTLGEQEPSDSRAVSDEFVAMAAIRCGQDGLGECREIVRKAIKQSQSGEE
jgi:hypothetical protein